MQVASFMKTLEKLKSQDSTLIDSIANFQLLIEGLNDLDQIVEMQEVKESILSQIKFLIINYVLMKDKKLDGHMVHTVLSGPPGVGKTELGKILSKIWLGLGLLNSAKTDKNVRQQPDDDRFQREIKNLKLSGRLKNDVIKKLQDYAGSIKQEIKDVELAKLSYQIRSLRRELAVKGCFDLMPQIETALEEVEKIDWELNTISESEISEERVHFWTAISKNSETLVDRTIDKVPDFIPAKDKTQESSITVVSREDFVAGYVGQTALKTEKLLQENFGKVLFIDEAYSLINADNDSFGSEALTVLNRYMSEHGDKIIIIFAGYSDLMKQTIFKAQPGLERRCAWHFEIPGYSPEGLSEIFMKQLHKNGWKVSPDVNMVDFFKRHFSRFPHYGGSTLQLCFYCKLAYSEIFFDEKGDEMVGQEITLENLERALQLMPKEKEADNLSQMYI